MKIIFSIVRPVNKNVYYRITFIGIEFINSFQVTALNIVFFNLQVNLIFLRMANLKIGVLCVFLN